MDALLEWLTTKATGDNALSLGILMSFIIAGRAIWWWGFRERNKDNANDVGVITDYHETATASLRQMTQSVVRIEGKLDQVLDGDGCQAKSFMPRDPGGSGIHQRGN